MLKTRTILIASVVAFVSALGVSSLSTSATAAGGEVEIPRRTWSFGGFGGQYDKAQLQRGFQVYKEVCAACHSISGLYFRNLAQPGGPEFPENAVKALAKTYDVPQPPNDDGEVKPGPAALSDRFPPLYANEKAARAAHNGALPPDLTIMARARGTAYVGPWYLHPVAMFKDIVMGYQEGGPNYIVALMTDYKAKPPAYVVDDKGNYKPAAAGQTGDNVKYCVAIHKDEHGKQECVAMPDGMEYNLAFPGHQIAMPNPFAAHSKDSPQVTYEDGTPQTVEQYSEDVAAFLAWSADPNLNRRKQMGWLVMIYLLITAILLYITKRRIWSGVRH